MTDAVQEIPDNELLFRHNQGDEHAFSELVKRHHARLWAVAVRVLGDPEEAADALQDAFLSAFRSAHRFRGEAMVSTWLHRIVINACHDRLRRKMVRPAVPTEDTALDLLSNERGKSTPDPTGRSDTSLDIHSALRYLPIEQRLALVLVDMLGYRVEDAAKILEVAPGTVKSRCARGRARLLPYLAHLRNPSGSPNVPSPKGGGRRS